jgi:GT2 family glycosyltransferase
MKQTASPFQVASGTIPIRISVVISHLNQPALLDRCLWSLHQGVRRPDEIIVVDNGSAASPEALCGAYPGARLFSEPALVPGPARNKGVAENSGDVLAFIDADCLADPVWGQRATRTGYRIRYVAGMKVYHPAHQTFSKMWKKWDRHSAHDYVAAWQHPGGLLRFLAKTLAMVLSPLAEIPRIIASDRLSGVRSRILVFAGLARAQLYRRGVMARLLTGSADTDLRGRGIGCDHGH